MDRQTIGCTVIKMSVTMSFIEISRDSVRVSPFLFVASPHSCVLYTRGSSVERTAKAVLSVLLFILDIVLGIVLQFACTCTRCPFLDILHFSQLPSLLSL